jgi:NitT/TauT family transport system substrate-binding protein
MNKSIILGVIGIIIISGILGVYFTSLETDNITNPNPIKISVNAWPGYSHVFIAQEKGFFETNGVNVELMLTSNYSESQELYLNGETDGIFEVFTDTIMHNANGIETKVVYVSDYSTTGDVIVGSVDHLSDLKGKTIGIGGINGFSHIFVLKALEEKANLQELDVFFKVVSAQDVLTFLDDDTISAGHTWEPIKSQSLRNGYTILASAEDVSGIITDVLAFDAQIIEERPEDIAAIVKSMIQARDFIEQNRDEGITIMAEQVGISYDEMSDGLDGVYLLNLEDNQFSMKNSQEDKSLYHTGSFISNFYLDRGQINVMPDLDDIIDDQFLDE